MTQAPQTQTQTDIAHARAILALGLPLIGSHLAQMALHVTDTILLGWYGVEELAAVVLGSSMFFIIFILGAGFARAIMPMVATALGRGDETQVRRDTRMGLWLSIGFGIVTYPVFWWSGPLLLTLGQDAEVSRLAQDFMRIAGIGMIPALLVMVLKSYLAALERTQALLWVTLAAVLVNLVFAYALIFGHWGMPEMGVKGAAIASVVVQFFTLLVMGAYAVWLPELRRFRLMQRFWRPDWPAMGRVFRLGWPIGMTSLAEGGLFQASALMMGWIGTIELAAHGIAMEVAALAFMIHMGLSNAATIRTGRFAGEGDHVGLRRSALIAIALSMAVAVMVVAVMLLAARPIITLFLDLSQPESAQIITFGVSLLALAALFQTADALQVMALGLLHGIRETRLPMWAAAISYWLIGVPMAYVMAFPLGWGGQGLWLGLTIGLVCAAVSMMTWFWSRAPRG
jgi:MATE family multidrug resistance protein